MVRFCSIVLFCVLLVSACTRTHLLSTITLPSIDGHAYSFKQLHQFKATVIVFLEPDCPISQKYTLLLRQLAKTFPNQNVELLAVYPMPYIKAEKIKNFAQKYQLPITHLIDSRQKLTQLLSASITPEVFLLNNEGEVIYQGMIDNWFYSLGKSRSVITEHYLTDAVASYLEKKPIAVKKTNAVGCDIEIRETW